MTYSANFYASNDYCICVAKAKNPLGPFKKGNAPIMKCGNAGEDFAGPGHNAFFYDKEGTLKMTFHIQTNEDEPSPNRKACICDAMLQNETIEFSL